MPLTIADAEDSYNHGDAFFREWQKEFEGRWFRPVGDAMIGALVNRMPPEVMNGLDPEMVKRLQVKYGPNRPG